MTTVSQESNFKQVWRKIVVGAIAVIVAVLLYLVSPLLLGNGAVKYADIEDHFKYGSIGGERANGIPYWIWKVLPVMFADKLPGDGYTSLGFIQEPGQELPIGFSQRKIFFNRVAQNCATCHAGSLRNTPESKPKIITAMPSNTVDLEGYIKFLAAVGVDKR
ncbi:MAG: cytochrome c, partial [Waterburya sp.]